MDARCERLNFRNLAVDSVRNLSIEVEDWKMKRWDVIETTPLTAKLSAIVSLVTWSAVISCGRLIAFF